MPMIFIRHVGANLAYVEPLGAVDPGFGQGGGGTDPDYGHPIFGRPGHDLPGGGHISNRPPMNPVFPDHSLPSGPPAHPVAPGEVLILMRDPEGIWHYAALAPGSPPPRPVPPGPPVHIGGIVPPGTEHPGGGPMPGAPPVAGQPLPPTAQPRR